MQNLCIDIGNSATKWAVFEGSHLVDFQRVINVNDLDLKSILENYKINNSIISTVAIEIEAIENVLKAQTNYIRFTTSLSNGVVNNYLSPNTLGLDRWAVMLAAKGLVQKNSCLVIDAGTCITYDLLEPNYAYFGGSISPGIQMRFKAMHEYTGRLPLIDFKPEENIKAGVDTITAMENGVLRGVLNEIEGFLAQNNNKFEGLKIILTGGDAPFLHKQLQNSIFAAQISIDPHLVLKGLNEVIS